MDQKEKRGGSANRQRAMIGLGLALILLLSVNIFSNVVFKPFQLDLTESKLFTVSDGTQQILSSMDEPIVLRLYFTKALGEGNPEHARHFVRVRELLEHYASLSGGKLKLELLDAAPFSKAEDKAMAFGLSGIPFNEAGDLGYFGLVGANSTDDLDLIRYLAPDREKFLEYDVTKLIHRLIKPKKKVIGLISSMAIGGAGTVPYRDAPRWPAIDQIREFFEVRPLPPYVGEIPDDIDVLMIVHPKKFDDHALYAIDQFVLNGGRALVFVDTLVESTGRTGNRDPRAAGRSEFDRMLNAWGLSLVPNRVAGDLDAARRIRVRHEGRIAVIDYVAWLALNPENFDGSDVTTSEINTLNVGTAGILEPVRAPGLTVTPLVTTGLKSMAIDGRKFSSQPDVIAMFRNFKPENRKLMLAARTTGIANTAFPGGPPSIKVTPPAADGNAPKAAASASANAHLTRS
ncbi:MAG: GldG family protein, partial [Alphaproteobacteria bacterium]|nr:GldG family protein [Alphaproteobacteria bacterium]